MKLHRESILSPETFDELKASFAVNNYQYLDKAISILEKFENPSIFDKIKSFNIGDFSNVSSTEFSYSFLILNDVFPSPVLRKIDMYTNSKNNGVDFVIENTEITSEALRLLKQIRDEKKQPYLVFEGDKFIYNGKSLNIAPGSYVYSILKLIYTILAGKSGEIKYEDLYKEIAKLPKFKRVPKAKVKADFRKYITSNTDGLGLKIKPTEQNGERLIKVIYSEGIYFNNGKKSCE